ncbi:MAG: hypothetical protein ABEH35_02825 [Haloarculaceae archaeon]
MSSDDDLSALVGDLVGALRELEAEFEPRTESGLPRPPSPREIVRFTSDVTIPAAILVLRTNIEALKLLQRALRLSGGRSPTADAGGEMRERAEQLSRATLSRLDDALADLQAALEGRPADEDAQELLDEARALQQTVEERLGNGHTNGDAGDGGTAEDVPVDVDAELQSIKDEFGDPDDESAGGSADDPGADDGDDDS